MIEIGDSIEDYRVLSTVTERDLSSTYVTEHIPTGTSPVLLTLWHGILLTESDDIQMLLKKARDGVIVWDSQKIPILDAKLYHQSPYIVTLYDEKINVLMHDYTTFMEQTVDHERVHHPDDPHASINTFLSTFCISPEANANNNGADPNITDENTVLHHNNVSTNIADENTVLHHNGINPNIADENTVLHHNIPFDFKAPIVPQASTTLKRWIRRPMERRGSRIASIVLLMILLAGILALLVNFLPASTATVTITPMSEQINHVYNIKLVTDTPQAGQASQYTISYTTPPQSKKVNVTGKGHRDAIQAHGKVVVSQIHLFNAGDNTIGISNIKAADGTEITVDGFTATEGGSVTVNGEATSGGQGGNIAAYDLNGLYSINRFTAPGVPGPEIGSAYVQNPNSFTGGADAADYTYVQQQDIDGAADTLTTQLTPDAQTHTQQKLQPDEEILSNITCNNDVKADHNVQDTAGTVTATVKVTCTGPVYKPKEVFEAAINLQKVDQFTRHSGRYQPSGDITTGQLEIIASSDGSSYSLEVPAKGLWVFQLDQATQQDIARAIAGKSQHDATDQLLSRQGIKNVTISTAGGIGSALPSSPENIKIVIVHI